MPYQKNAISIGNKELRFVDAATGNPIEIDVDIYSSEIHVRSEVFVIKIPGQTLDWGLLGNSGTNPALNYLGTTDAQPLVIKTTNIERARILANGNIGIGINSPTSTLHINGSVAEAITVISSTTVLNSTHNKIVLNNGATNITITLPDALTCIGRKYEFTRYKGSKGTITVVGSGTNQIQALAGTVGATTTLGAHSTVGAGLGFSFTAVNIGGIGVWLRL